MSSSITTTPDDLVTRFRAMDDDFMFFSAEETPPTKAQIDALEKKLGIPLHADHRALLAKIGCCAVLANETVWPRPVEFEVRPFWQFLRGVEVFGLARETTPVEVDLLVQTAARKPAGKKKLVAAMGRIGEPSCIGYDANGTLLQWEPGGKPTIASGSSLFGILLEWLRTLEDDKERMKVERPHPKATIAASGAKAKGANEWLSELLDESAEQKEVAAALMKEAPELRGEVIAAIVSRLDEPETGSPRRPIAGLVCLESDARAVDALIALATKGCGDLRPRAITALRLLDGRPPRAVPVLVSALADEDEDVVYRAAMALKEYADPRAIEPLKDALAKAQKNPRWVYELLAGSLMEALAAAGAGRDDVIDLLTSNLSPPLNSNAGVAAFDALIIMGAKAKRAIPALEAMTDHDNLYLATMAHHALGAITGDYKSHLAALRAAKKSKDEGVQGAAETALIAAQKAEIDTQSGKARQ